MSRRRQGQKPLGQSVQGGMVDAALIADPEVLRRPTPLDLVRRILLQIGVVVALLIGGAVLPIVGVVISLRGSGGSSGTVMAVVGLLMLLLARVLMRGGGLRWALRGVGQSPAANP